MLIRKCDRCGAAYDDYFDRDKKDGYNAIKTVHVQMGGGSWTADTFDLCPECKKSFHAWLMEGGK